MECRQMDNHRPQEVRRLGLVLPRDPDGMAAGDHLLNVAAGLLPLFLRAG
jgi:hypothetical protein